MTARSSLASRFAGLFFLSGFVGVLVEQIFERLLSVLVGGTTPAAALVLVVYFAGLCLGGFASTWLVRRYRFDPSKGYAAAEISVAVSALAVLLFFTHWERWVAPVLLWGGTGPLEKLISRLLITVPVAFPSAFAMGVSFPLLSGMASRISGTGSRYVARLYTLNLFGAALAAILAPYAVFPFLGLSGGLALSAVADLFVGFAAWKLGSGAQAVETPAAPAGRMHQPDTPVVVIAFVSGLVFFILEVTWTYLAGVVINCSVYAFSSMLFIVLLGLGLGSRALSQTVERGKDQTSLGFLFLASAGVLFVQSTLWPSVPGSIAAMGKDVNNFYLGEAIRWFHLALLLLPVTFLYGMIYPSIFSDERFDGPGCSRLLGYATGANAIGSVIGALAAFFICIPVLGAEATLRVMVTALAGCGLAMFLMDRRYRALAPALCATALLVFAVLRFPGWNKLQLTSGVNVYFKYDNVNKDTKLLFYNEHSYGGVTTVVENIREGRRVKTLLTNGKFQGDDSLQTFAQIGFTAIPSMHMANRDDALVIGFGTGQSAGMLRSIGFQSVDVAEISSGILEASRKHFASTNRGILNDPAASVFLEDGRNVLLTREKRYDLIAIEVTSVWFSGSTNIYSREFYQLAKSRLKTGGFLQQWIQLHHITPHEVEAIIGTVRAAFPHVSLWFFGGQGIIVASETKQQIDPGGQDRVYKAVLRESEGNEVRARAFVQALTTSRVLDCPSVTRLAAREPVINTDWNRWLEYWTPTHNLSQEDWVTLNLEGLAKYRGPELARQSAPALLPAHFKK